MGGDDDEDPRQTQDEGEKDEWDGGDRGVFYCCYYCVDDYGLRWCVRK